MDNENTVLLVTEAPHDRSTATVSKRMTQALIALLPSMLLSGLMFGGRVLMLTGMCILSAMLWERLFDLIAKKPDTTKDLSAAITGMIFAFMLPPTFPYWKAAAGTLISIVVFKQLFGGLGKNLFNPAAAGKLVTYFLFTKDFVYIMPFTAPESFTLGLTPLEGDDITFYELFLGKVCGNIGEISVLASLLGCFYLLSMRVASLYSPLAFMVSVFSFSWVSGRDALFQLMTGGVVFAAVFLASDNTTTPLTPLGKLIFGIGAGAIVCMLRMYTPFGDLSVYIAILAMNLLTPLIDRLIENHPRP